MGVDDGLQRALTDGDGGQQTGGDGGLRARVDCRVQADDLRFVVEDVWAKVCGRRYTDEG